uniref:DNA N(6)-methyladenine demethylase n=2 Tax=Cajanus cajan TaxID=3821 RepID=A0A151RSG9_CAJCA|nr:Alpha-ketoglutarate-dependent dioxygenase alkB isogeny [Cajanus cajan]
MSSSDHSTSSSIATTSVKPRKSKRKTRINLGLSHASEENCSVPHTKEFSTSNLTSYHDESPQDSHSWKKKDASFKRPYYNSPTNSNYSVVGHNLDSPVGTPKFKPFDICFQRKRNSPSIGATSHRESNEMGIEMQEEEIQEEILLGPGMVLLKNFITHDEQVEIVKVCRELGVGPGGFYQPGYASGAKLRLKMMCLGKDWDPQTYKYGKKRVIDGSEPPSIPNYFSELVSRSIKEAHSLIKKECRVWNVEDELPSMTPDICIVNFYTNNGKLGLHQDRDESRESLRKGLPVVSFSIGDSAEFLYGDQRDVEMAESVLLESGDVLIFGGESRHVFHGVSSVLPNSAPEKLLRDSCLIPGRLNLTFRQY